MNTAAKNILQRLAGVSSLEEVDIDSLRSIVTQYPWFGPAQLLLAKKLQAGTDGEAAGTAAVQAAVYFSNPYWLHFVLTQDESSGSETEVPADETSQKKENAVEPGQPDGAGEHRQEEDKLVSSDTKNETEQRLASLLRQQAEEFKRPVERDSVLPIKESPLYTIDYFASQGIHIESIKAGRDKLDIKVKKFTDWLRQMKSASPQPADLGTDPETEHLIETIAQNSNEAKDIITEAMAEVLVKQGKTEKAVQLYQKLSFLNPDKSVYFAAKIEKIKEN